jgi:hypothetical protein
MFVTLPLLDRGGGELDCARGSAEADLRVGEDIFIVLKYGKTIKIYKLYHSYKI